MPLRATTPSRTHPTGILKQSPNRRPVPTQPTSNRPGQFPSTPSLPHLNNLRFREPSRHRTPPSEKPQLSPRVLRSRLEAAAHMGSGSAAIAGLMDRFRTGRCEMMFRRARVDERELLDEMTLAAQLVTDFGPARPQLICHLTTGSCRLSRRGPRRGRDKRLPGVVPGLGSPHGRHRRRGGPRYRLPLWRRQ